MIILIIIKNILLVPTISPMSVYVKIGNSKKNYQKHVDSNYPKEFNSWLVFNWGKKGTINKKPLIITKADRTPYTWRLLVYGRQSFLDWDRFIYCNITILLPNSWWYYPSYDICIIIYNRTAFIQKIRGSSRALQPYVLRKKM